MYKLLLKSTFIISISFMPYYAFSQDSSGIEEVVVTAEKREQNLTRCSVINYCYF